MLIKTKKELQFYLAADLMMNRGDFKWSLKRRLKGLVCPDYVMEYLRCMRKYNYYKNKSLYKPYTFYLKMRFLKLGSLLGFSIGEECFDYGLVLMHPGTIVVGSCNRIGAYANINTSTCIINNGSRIGDFLFLSAGAKIISGVTLGDNIMIGANSVATQNSDGLMGGVLIGIPAKFRRKSNPWIFEGGYDADKKWVERYNAVESLKKRMFNF